MSRPSQWVLGVVLCGLCLTSVNAMAGYPYWTTGDWSGVDPPGEFGSAYQAAWAGAEYAQSLSSYPSSIGSVTVELAVNGDTLSEAENGDFFPAYWYWSSGGGGQLVQLFFHGNTKDCPNGETWNGTVGGCEPPTPKYHLAHINMRHLGNPCPSCQPKNKLKKPGTAGTKAHIDIGSGNEYHEKTDYRSGDGRLTFSRFYNSAVHSGSTFSTGWRDNYSSPSVGPVADVAPHAVVAISADYSSPSAACVQGAAVAFPHATSTSSTTSSTPAAVYLGNFKCQLPNGMTVPVYSTAASAAWTSGTGYADVVVRRPDGSLYQFNCSANFCAKSDSATPVKLTASSSGYTVTDQNDTVETFASNGHLKKIAYRGGYQQDLTYNAAGQLAMVADSFGRSLTFNYNGNGTLSRLTTPAGNVVSYGYASGGQLSTVTYPDGGVVHYQYQDPLNTDLLTGISDANGNPYIYIGYDSKGRADRDGFTGGVWSSTLDYTDPANVEVTDAFGVKRIYHFEPDNPLDTNSQQRLTAITSATGTPEACDSCDQPQAITYDSGGYYATTTDWDGVKTTYHYNDARGLLLTRTQAANDSSAHPATRTTTIQWEPNYHEPHLISVYSGASDASGDPTGTLLRTTELDHDSAGNLTALIVTDAKTGQVRQWQMPSADYTSWGAPTVIIGPRTDVADTWNLSYYDTSNSSCSATSCPVGQIKSITNPLGQTTTFTAYDGNGRPLSVTDPNGVVTTYTYDARGRLTSRDFGGLTTGFAYDKAGDITQVTLPGNVTYSYRYNGAHQLVRITDGLGNYVQYTVDAMGNRTKTQMFDANGDLTYTHRDVFNALDQLARDIGAANQTWSYQHDGNDNITQATDPAGNVTLLGYDALNRINQVTDALGGISDYTFDPNGALVAATDFDGNTTAYTDDGLGKPLKVKSPDTGTSTDTYDVAGNLLTHTDARGDTTTYSYDALNRVTSITYADGSTITNSYDSCPNGVGRLCQSSASNGTTVSWSYDRYGHVTARIDDIPVGSTDVRFSTAYSYDSAGRLRTMSYPSGLTVTYHYDAAGRVAGLDLNGQSYMTNVTYAPFGPVTGWDWSNGQRERRTYNTDGQLISATLGSATRTFTYDANGNITGVSGPNTAQSLSYDALNRLVGDSGSGTGNNSLGWTYDANGNRLSQNDNGTDTRYRIAGSSNRLTAVGGTGYQYDADGNLISDGVHTYGYDARNRLTTVDGGSTATYLYNALGQRVEKHALLPSPASSTIAAHAPARAQAATANRVPTTVLFVYDTQGHLIGEYNDKGNPIEETVYLNNLPVATVRSGTPDAIYTDQLGTPRVITSPSGTVVWRWDSGPFGTGQPDESPSGGKPFVYNLRFPGQYYDAETGHDYNYYRDYDPAIGRYVESDPTGLYGGLNTYAYVLDNPLYGIDPTGEILVPKNLSRYLRPICIAVHLCRPPHEHGERFKDPRDYKRGDTSQTSGQPYSNKNQVDPNRICPKTAKKDKMPEWEKKIFENKDKIPKWMWRFSDEE